MRTLRLGVLPLAGLILSLWGVPVLAAPSPTPSPSASSFPSPAPSPLASLVEPQQNATFTAPATIVLRAVPTGGGLRKVEFFQNARKLGEATQTPYVFTWQAVQPGRYTLQARATSMTGVSTDSSPTTVHLMSAIPAATGFTLTATPASAGPRESLSASWTAPAGQTSSNDWIGLFEAGAEHTTYLAYQYTAGTVTGTRTFMAPPTVAGKSYQFRYFLRGGYDAVAASNLVTVASVPASGSYSLTASPSTVAPSQPATIAWTAPGPGGSGSGDWIGLYPEAETNLYRYSTWTYVEVGPTRGSVTLVTPSTPGRYVARYLRSNGYDSVAVSNAITVTAQDTAPTNSAPLINAGTDQINTFPNPAHLIATVSDDGLPMPPGRVTVSWSVVTNPATATVTLTTPTAVDTLVRCSEPGTYVLRATATDGALSSFDDVQILLKPPVSGNTAPTVNAGADQTITLPAVATLTGTATDDGLPTPPGALTYQWTTWIGPAMATFGAPTSRTTTVSFPESGPYVLRLTVSDGQLSTVDEIQMTVKAAQTTSNLPPTISLTSPAVGATFTAPATIELAATAGDVDGSITKVEFFQGTTKLGEDAVTPYTFSWTDVAAGTYSLTAKAMDDTGASATSASVTMTVTAASPPTGSYGLVATPTTVSAGQEITVTWTAPATHSLYDWVALFRSGASPQEYLPPYRYLPAGAGDMLTFTAPSMSGTYEVRGYANNGYATLLVTSQPITVGSSGGVGSTYTLTATLAGSSVTVAWTAPATHSATDWVALYKPGAPDTDYASLGIPYQYLTAATSGTLTFAAPTTAGTYEARAYNNIYTLAATSALITVGAGTASPTNQPPIISLTSPAPSATFAAPATITLQATASDSDGVVSKVEFFAGATKLGETTTSPYRYTWSNVAAGPYSLTAKVTDDKGASATSSVVTISVTQTPSATGYTLMATPPAVGLGQAFTVVWTAPASHSQYDWIALFRAGDQPQEYLSPYYYLSAGTGGSFNFTAPSTAGTYEVRCYANNGYATLLATSSPISVGSTPPVTNKSPSVNLISPTPNATFTAPATIELAAIATDAEGTIAKVEFFQGTTKLGEDLQAPYTFTWTGVLAGVYQLTAKATDDQGAMAISGAVPITVSSTSNQSPTVRITAPSANATFVAPATILLSAEATDKDGTITKVEFFQDQTKLGQTLTAPYTITWTVTMPGPYTLTAKATDNAGLSTVSSPVSVTVTSKLPSPTEVLQTVSTNYALINDLKADMTVSTILDLQPFGEDSYCRYAFKRPDKEKIESYAAAARTNKTDIILIRGSMMDLINPVTNTRETIDLLADANLSAPQWNQMDLYYNVSAFIDSHTLSINEAETDIANGIIMVEAVPKVSSSFYSKLKLAIDSQKGLLAGSFLFRENELQEKLELTESQRMPNGAWVPIKLKKTPMLTSGNMSSTMTFSNVQINVGLTDADFDPTRQ